ncbi:hypothetical protein EWE75_15640 [Sphingomonas populi]|uniref:Uncharacterized protein n=1 Tax=Sphingomonas populi TaxID=2484750 RepID=A0A4V2DD22_9SPHN|nr:hypothetical protein [Sphingomonas populi]RZF63478.1 hypothetical protein EWE75_15640 [Sphingomonas populi]
MNTERKPIDFGGLDDFDTRPKATPQTPETKVAERKAVDQMAGFPSRERSDEGQINIRAQEQVLNRFREMAKKERYKLGAFLEIMMDVYEQRNGG